MCRHNLLILIMFTPILFFGLTGCSSSAPPRAVIQQPLNPAVLQILRSLAKGHQDKTQLAFLADFKGLSKSVGQFNSYMSRSQGKLLNQLKAWAQKHHVTLHYFYRPGLYGKAQKIIADNEGSLLLHSNAADFQKRYLIMMYMDYSWQLAMDQAASTQAQRDHAGPGLLKYLRDATAVNKQSLADLWKLLEHYHWNKSHAGHAAK
jgi:predicted outer membrane protein